MLIKRVSPHDPDLTKEVKYMLTADIQEMAGLVGIHPDRLRNILRYASEATKPAYGVARPSTFFVTACNVKRPRALSLSQVDIRAQDGFRLDASESFVIMPIYVMRPSFVGNLESANGVRYELIPNLRLRAPNMGDRMFYQYVNLENPYGDLARELENSEGTEIGHDLMGWDLVMLPEESGVVLPSDYIDPTPTESLTEPADENLIYDYGFGVTVEYIYTSDNKDCLRIDHNVYYKGRGVFHREETTIVPPSSILKDALRYMAVSNLKDTESEAYEIMRCIYDASGYAGIGFRRS